MIGIDKEPELAVLIDCGDEGLRVCDGDAASEFIDLLRPKVAKAEKG